MNSLYPFFFLINKYVSSFDGRHNPDTLFDTRVVDSIIVERTSNLSRKEVFEYH